MTVFFNEEILLLSMAMKLIPLYVVYKGETKIRFSPLLISVIFALCIVQK